MVQIVPGYPQITLPKLLHSLSGLLSFLAAALARVSEPQAIFTRR